MFASFVNLSNGLIHDMTNYMKKLNYNYIENNVMVLRLASKLKIKF